MNLDHYQFKIRPDYFEYEFYSTGSKGRIKKLVVFSLVKSEGLPVFNLAFGDWIEEKRQFDDTAVSNNGDRLKILSTIAVIVIDFTSHFPNVLIYVEGSTAARTRLYQMSISSLWDEAKLLFQIYGMKSDEIFEPFRKNENYQAFLALRIKSDINIL